MKTKNAVPWWETAVIYHIYPFSFYDSNNDGLGDLEGIIEKLDYLNDGTPNSLGVDAIWITPFYPSGWADYGYDVSDYTGIDPRFGTITTFQSLIEEAHRRNIKIILDFVANHTSEKHPWFLESKCSRESAKRNWYIWAEPAPGGGPPTAHQSVFGGSAWELDPLTAQYYFHYFYKEQPDLNWRKQDVRRAMNDNLHFWLKLGVDGFRFDAVKHLSEKFIGADPASFPAQILTDAERYFIFREWRKILDSYGAVGISEAWETDFKKWLSYYGENLDEFHLPLSFFFMKTEWSAQNIRRIVDQIETNLPFGAAVNWAVGNHDISRFVNRYGKKFARVGAMLLLTLRGAPIIYYGDEIGMHDVTIPEGCRRDRIGRDAVRTPMQWTDALYAGFSKVAPWMPVADDFNEISVARELSYPRSLLSLYRTLTWLRKTSKALSLGEYKALDVLPPDCFVYVRSFGEEKLLIALNFSSEGRQLTGSSMRGRGDLLLSTYMDRNGLVNLKNIILRPHEGCIVRL